MMKKTITTVIILLISVVTFAQNPWKDILKPVTADAVWARTLGADEGGTSTLAYTWIPRLSVGMQAKAITLKADPMESQSVTAIGYGLTFAKYGLVNDKPYTPFAITAMVLTSVRFNDVVGETKFGVAVVGGFFNNWITIGPYYMDEKFGFLTGVNFTF